MLRIDTIPGRGSYAALGLDLYFLRFFGSPIEHGLDRRADRLIRAMNTAQPATRPADPFLEFRDQPLNMLLARLGFLDEGHPADPLIARQRRQALPCG